MKLIVCVLIAAVAVPACSQTGRVLRVGDGESIQQALQRAGPGDTVLVGGVHVENVSVATDGVTIEGQGGAEIHGYMDWTPRWVPAELGRGIFRAPCPREPEFLCYDGKMVLKCTRNRKLILQQGSLTKEARTPGHFKHIRGVWAYMDGWVYLRTPDGADPSDATVVVSAPDSACVLVEADDVTIRGLTLRYATFAVLARNAGRVVIEYCTVGPTAHGIRLGRGVHDSVVRYCQVSCPAVFAWRDPQAPRADGTDLVEDIYFINKPQGPKNRRSIALRNAGANNEVAYNHIHDCYQGIEAKQDTDEGIRNAHRNLRVHHNYIHDTAFYGLCPNGVGINGRWHHNLVVNTHSAAIRIKQPSVIGPLYIYRNVIDHDGGRPWWASDPQAGPIFIIHNTFRGGWTMIRLADGHVPNLFILANAFIGQTRAYRHGRFIGIIRPEQIDYNLINHAEAELYDKLLAAGYQAHGVAAPLDDDADDAAILAAGKDKGPDWNAYVRALRRRLADLPEVLPGTECVQGRGDIGAYEEGFTTGDDQVGVDPALCGAKAFHQRKGIQRVSK